MKNRILSLLTSDSRFKLISTSESRFTPNVSVVVPIHNQEVYVIKHLTSILENAKNIIELIIINDASSDKTHDRIIDFIETIEDSNIHSIRYFRTRLPMFETRCDDFAIRISKCEFIIEIQSDMIIHEKNFDDSLLKLIKSNNRFAILGCRGVMKIERLKNLNLNRFGREINDSIIILLFRRLKFNNIRDFLRRIVRTRYVWPKNKGFANFEKLSDTNENSLEVIFPELPIGNAGWLDRRIDLLPYSFDATFDYKLNQFRNKIWKGESVMRGPIILRKTAYLEVGGFNVNAFYQGLDDHDLVIRLRDLSYEVGFSPIYFSAPTSLGTARNNRRMLSNLWSKLHRYIRQDNILQSRLFKELSKIQSNKKS